MKGAIRCVLTALNALHDAELVHRDVRWPNIVKVGDDWYLVDLDSADRIGRPIPYRPTDSPPEIQQGSVWGVRHDIWQVGRLLDHQVSGLLDSVGVDFARFLKTSCQTAQEALQHPWLASAV